MNLGMSAGVGAGRVMGILARVDEVEIGRLGNLVLEHLPPVLLGNVFPGRVSPVFPGRKVVVFSRVVLVKPHRGALDLGLHHLIVLVPFEVGI